MDEIISVEQIRVAWVLGVGLFAGLISNNWIWCLATLFAYVFLTMLFNLIEMEIKEKKKIEKWVRENEERGCKK